MSSSRVPPSPSTQQALASPQPTPADSASPPSKRDLKSWWKGFKKDQPKEDSKGVQRKSYRQISLFQEGPMTGDSPVYEVMSAEALRELNVGPSDILPKNVPDEFTRPSTSQKLQNIVNIPRSLFRKGKKTNTNAKLITGDQPSHIWRVPLRQSITYANVAISLQDAQGKSYIYGYVPIVVAKCGVYLKEHGEWPNLAYSLDRLAEL